MKKIFCCLLLIIPIWAIAQITIDNNDMPVPNDTFRLSLTNNLQGIDPALTGQNYTWDFTALTPNSQTIDTFFSVLSSYIPVAYNLVFNNPLDQAHKATVATRSFVTTNPVPQVQISETYDFFKVAGSGYTKVGQGAKINGLPAPMKYDVPEIFYTFPVQYGHIDSSASAYGLSVPGMGYYGQFIKRVNTVDGYGSLTTPYGTFDAMRIKSVIYTSDTIYLDTISHGFLINRPTETQYIWLGDNQGDPLLLVSKTNNNTNVRYKDHFVATDVSNNLIRNREIRIIPNPVKESFTVFSDIPYSKIEILDITGKLITTQKNKTGEINISTLTEGLYFIKIYDNNNILLATKKINKK
ncbi:MAG: T9SS type A sorting domain-containing protein [Bacteroidia bacterium]|nr:T9SS type A sorting domain-containing protein [Bacteroidia bacterium]